MARGGCSDSQRAFFWDAAAGRCRPFVFSGCGGNANNFPSAALCESACGGRGGGGRGGGPLAKLTLGETTEPSVGQEGDATEQTTQGVEDTIQGTTERSAGDERRTTEQTPTSTEGTTERVTEGTTERGSTRGPRSDAPESKEAVTEEVEVFDPPVTAGGERTFTPFTGADQTPGPRASSAATLTERPLTTPAARLQTVPSRRRGPAELPTDAPPTVSPPPAAARPVSGRRPRPRRPSGTGSSTETPPRRRVPPSPRPTRATQRAALRRRPAQRASPSRRPSAVPRRVPLPRKPSRTEPQSPSARPRAAVPRKLPVSVPHAIENLLQNPLVEVPAPDLTSIVPDLTSAGRDLTSVGPDLTSIAPDLTSASRDLTSVGPYLTSVGPDLTSAAPETDVGGPLRSRLLHFCLHPALEPSTPECTERAERLERFFYDQQTGQCETFLYGGCGATLNHFVTRSDCERTCRPLNMCFQPMPRGATCEDGYTVTKYFFNTVTSVCEPVSFQECEELSNSFSDIESCILTCEAPSFLPIKL